ncbi:MAG: YHS domain-containing (seleno)protein [Betaproteobacteria bacterium]
MGGLVLVMSLAPAATWAADKQVYTGLFSNVALSGYDAVAYFTENKPVKGDAKFAQEYQGAQWHFASAANRDAFAADPKRFAPQYGGYCAWAVSEGSTASADPKLWKIVDGKLYLNYDADVQKKWDRDIPGHIRKADQNWPKVLGK